MRIMLVLLITAILSSCIGQRLERQAEEDQRIIEDYIHVHNLNTESLESGLYYVIEDEGTGARPDVNSTVTVAYKGYLTDGSVFDQSEDEGATFSLAQVIEGWQQGIPLFKEGGKGMLLIPSALGYGSSDRPGIPANSVLIFEVELIEIK